MKIRILSLVCVTTAATLLAGCAVYKNPSACEQLMRSKLADTSTDTLKIDHAGAAIDGTRVVVEGTIEHVMTASEVAAATPPVVAANAAGASETAAAAVAKAASSANALAPKNAKPKKTTTAAAAECTFHGETLGVFTWLAPAKLAAPPAEAAEE
ncbi:hypothetical protein [Paraburkholderia sp. BCC1876]|uniref:hypothetical protein n=1 Tax=Paraburkholderia sp. BCC1876 TaxID=2676303 RepID=UPI00158FE710|nr:hypothetical protein [Paraburkholderia sp. BCC1876]